MSPELQALISAHWRHRDAVESGYDRKRCARLLEAANQKRDALAKTHPEELEAYESGKAVG